MPPCDRKAERAVFCGNRKWGRSRAGASIGNNTNPKATPPPSAQRTARLCACLSEASPTISASLSRSRRMASAPPSARAPDRSIGLSIWRSTRSTGGRRLSRRACRELEAGRHREDALMQKLGGLNVCFLPLRHRQTPALAKSCWRASSAPRWNSTISTFSARRRRWCSAPCGRGARRPDSTADIGPSH